MNSIAEPLLHKILQSHARRVPSGCGKTADACPPNETKIKVASKERVLQELVTLLISYPGGVTEAIVLTNLQKKLRQVSEKDDLATQTDSTLSAVPFHKVPGVGTGHGMGALVHAKIVQVLSGKEGPISVILSHDESRIRGLMPLAQRYQKSLVPHQPGAAVRDLAAGVKVRLANVTRFSGPSRKPMPGVDPCTLEPEPPEWIYLLPSQHMVTVRDMQKESRNDKSRGWAELCSAKVEQGSSVDLPGEIQGRVVSIGPKCNQEGYQSHPCDRGEKRSHRYIMIEPPEGCSDPGFSKLPLLLFDNNVALADLVNVEEEIMVHRPVVQAFSRSEHNWLLTDNLEPFSEIGEATPMCFDRCLGIGAESCITVCPSIQPSSPDARSKRQKLARSSAVGKNPWIQEEHSSRGYSSDCQVLIGEVLSICQHRALANALPQEGSLITVRIITNEGQAEVKVVANDADAPIRSLPRLAPRIFPGHMMIAFPVSYDRTAKDCIHYTFNCALSGACFQSLSTMPGLLASPQIHRPCLVDTISEAIRRTSIIRERTQSETFRIEDSPKGLGPLLLKVELLDAHLRVHRVHSHCQRPIIASSLMDEAFFVDSFEEQIENGSAEIIDDACETNTANTTLNGALPASQLDANFRDGVWDCQFCHRECGSTEVSLRLIGFVLVRGCGSKSESPGRAVNREERIWIRADGAALECMAGVNADEFAGMSRESRACCIKAMLHRPMLLSIVPATILAANSGEPQVSLDKWTLPCLSQNLTEGITLESVSENTVADTIPKDNIAEGMMIAFARKMQA